MPKLDSDDLDLTVVPSGYYGFDSPKKDPDQAFYSFQLATIPFLYYQGRFLDFDASFEGFLPTEIPFSSIRYVATDHFSAKIIEGIRHYLETYPSLVLGYLQFRIALKALANLQTNEAAFLGQLEAVFHHYDHFKKELIFYQREQHQKGVEPFHPEYP